MSIPSAEFPRATTAAAYFAVFLVLRALSVLSSIRASRLHSGSTRRFRSRPARTVAVLGSGGHTTEMMRLLSGLEPSRYTPLIFVVADTDVTSLDRVRAAAAAKAPSSLGGARVADAVYSIPRSREVGQSYWTSVPTTLRSFLYALYVVVRTRPDVVLCNGPGTCLPIAVCALACRILGMAEGNVVFVESFCRVQTLSLTGRLLYPIADRFIVHWPELRANYPRSEVVSTFIRHGVVSKKDS